MTFTRDADAVLIPDGVTQTLPEGTRGWITQVLGGNYTVQLETGRLVRIAASDADAIGRSAGEDSGDDPNAPVTADRIWNALKDCYDPEIPLNIVDLGLIYELVLKEHADAAAAEAGGAPADTSSGVDVLITMTLTAPGCGMGQVLSDDVVAKVRALPGVADVKVELTFDPPWSPERMSEEGRLELGMYY